MQFDGNELEKDDKNNLPDDGDTGAISWEDLLNTDDNDDLSSLIVNSDDAEKGEPATKGDIADFDMSTLSEDNVLEPAKEDFNLKEAATNYVNSLDKDDADIGDVQENVQEEAPQTSGAALAEDDILSVLSDDDILTEKAADIASGEDLSDVVDDELLSLLDVKNDSPSTYSEGNLDDILEINSKGDFKKEVEAPLDEAVSGEPVNVAEQFDGPDNDTSEDLSEEEPEVFGREEAKLPEINEQEDSEIQPVYQKKEKINVFVFVALGLVGLFVFIMLVLHFFFPNIAGNSSSEELATSTESNYQMPNENIDDAAEMQKQTEELINKLENKSEKTSKKEDKDKKVVVSVQASGRSNPFMPSSLFSEDGSLAMGGDLSLPPDVDVNSPEAIAGRKLLSIVVSGIMYDSERPSAILKFDGNDYFVQKGDKIDTYSVKQITKEYVQIANGANVYKAYVGEAFNIGEIPQSRQMKYSGKTRQYISADDIEISTK